MFRAILLITAIIVGLAACNSDSEPVARQDNRILTNPRHSTAGSETEKTSSRKRSPMEKYVDVSAESEAIEDALKKHGASPGSEDGKKAVAKAYYDRAFALTKAAQYRAALGDFRKGMKLDPENQEAKSMHDEIIRIFKSIGRQPPKEGEEPPPLTEES